MRQAHRAASVIAALCGSIFLLFLVAQIARLIGAGGADGLRHLFTDAELRSALALTALTATCPENDLRTFWMSSAISDTVCSGGEVVL